VRLGRSQAPWRGQVIGSAPQTTTWKAHGEFRAGKLQVAAGFRTERQDHSHRSQAESPGCRVTPNFAAEIVTKLMGSGMIRASSICIGGEENTVGRWTGCVPKALERRSRVWRAQTFRWNNQSECLLPRPPVAGEEKNAKNEGLSGLRHWIATGYIGPARERAVNAGNPL